ncbi:Hypothetical predicted protein [Marmota monax]|uniref:Alpha-defensin N-terminal domain-containing protein n=1 Tax=Marmota monax TaxID=9995 RepID=A0A5E4CHM6_MARMO|nr:Hypothetical predicted protein [Marmota monax]
MQPAPRSTHTQAPASSPPVTPAMRTLTLLAALLLLALQAQAEPLPENNEEAPDQEQPGEEDQDTTISFAGPEAPGLQRSGERPHHGAVWRAEEGLQVYQETLPAPAEEEAAPFQSAFLGPVSMMGSATHCAAAEDESSDDTAEAALPLLSLSSAFMWIHALSQTFPTSLGFPSLHLFPFQKGITLFPRDQLSALGTGGGPELGSGCGGWAASLDPVSALPCSDSLKLVA